MLLLGHLSTRHNDWHNAELRVTRIIESGEGEVQTHKHMNQILGEVRVTATFPPPYIHHALVSSSARAVGGQVEIGPAEVRRIAHAP